MEFYPGVLTIRGSIKHTSLRSWSRDRGKMKRQMLVIPFSRVVHVRPVNDKKKKPLFVAERRYCTVAL